jgi:CheY-like chemotaxis protein
VRAGDEGSSQIPEGPTPDASVGGPEGGNVSIAVAARRGIEFAPITFMSELQGIIVVLVEDDPDSLAMFATMLMQQGAVVLPAPDAKEALETLSGITPNVLVSDMQMPERDGAWLVTEARRQGLLRGVPTVVVTAQTMTPQQVQEAGFDASMRKPVDPTVLCDTLRTLARPGSRAPAPSPQN